MGLNYNEQLNQWIKPLDSIHEVLGSKDTGKLKYAVAKYSHFSVLNFIVGVIKSTIMVPSEKNKRGKRQKRERKLKKQKKTGLCKFTWYMCTCVGMYMGRKETARF